MKKFVWLFASLLFIGALGFVGAKNVNAANDKNILFAHGMDVGESIWNTFSKHAESKGYKVYRTDVSKCGSIATRAKDLADYINSPAHNISDGSLIMVGHSMGGLDIRYLIGVANENKANGNDKFVKAAKKIKSVYTLATPHGGVTGAPIASLFSNCKPAINDLSNAKMAEFNKRFPYSKFNNPATDNRITFLAFHFQCPIPGICNGFTDCQVGTDGQTWKGGAPGRPRPSLQGAHARDMDFNFITSIHCKAEQSQTKVLDEILDANK